MLQIDANSDGRVDWEEFSSFMFLNDNRHVKADYVPRLFSQVKQKELSIPQDDEAVVIGEL